MRVYSIADIHLSHAVPNKAMDVFGAQWKNHTERLAEAWKRTVRPGDIVLINGDISWAMHFSEAREDLFFIHSLPGIKVLLRGNHDYWWTGYEKLRSMLPPSVLAVQNNCIRIKNICIGGTRLWNIPGSGAYKESEDRKIYEREKLRLALSLRGFKEGENNFVMLHFPPFSEKETESEVTAILKQYSVTAVVYGHLHGVPAQNALNKCIDGLPYYFTAADSLQFTPKLIFEG